MKANIITLLLMPAFIFTALIVCGFAAARLAAEDNDSLTRQKRQDRFESLARDLHSCKLQITVDEAIEWMRSNKASQRADENRMLSLSALMRDIAEFAMLGVVCQLVTIAVLIRTFNKQGWPKKSQPEKDPKQTVPVAA